MKITSGQYWGECGLSNFWHWREVLPNGKLGKDESGYGWARATKASKAAAAARSAKARGKGEK